MSRKIEWPKMVAALTEAELNSVVRLLELLAKEADSWSDTVSNRFRPLMCEPKKTQAYPGSNSAYTIGDLRRARSIVTKLREP